MRIQTIASAAAALAMVATPVIASAKPANAASSLSLVDAAKSRASAKGGKRSKLAGVGILPIVLGLGVIGGGVALAVTGNDNPSSN